MYSKFTSQNLADGLASLGVLIMGESDKSTPIVLIRDINLCLSDKKYFLSFFRHRKQI